MRTLTVSTVIALFIWLFMLSGCTKTARMYGISKNNSGKVAEVQFSYTGSGHGKVWGQLPDGETFEGEYFTRTGVTTDEAILKTELGTITGLSLSQAHGQVTHITAVGSSGTMIQGISFPRGSHGVGSLIDSKGREWKIHY